MIRGSPFNAREAVETLTSASFATSLRRAARAFLLFGLKRASYDTFVQPVALIREGL